MPSEPFNLASVATFAGLSTIDLALLQSRLQPIHVGRGTLIVEEGAGADALYAVVTGRFAVEVGGNPSPVTEIGQGATIGEIAFFAGGLRTATVRAIRDSVVVRLTRADFDEISRTSPAIWQTITSTLATRLAAETRKTTALRHGMRDMARAGPRPRTITLIRAGGGGIPAKFIETFTAAARSRDGTFIVSSKTIGDHISNGSAADASTTAALNELEARYHTIVFAADETLTPWSEKVIRQADAILAVAAHPDGPVGSAVALNSLETFARSLHRPAAHRLVLVHNRAGGVQGTRHWLSNRNCFMHHHAALESRDDAERLWRFLRGEALGYVAGGGGAYSAAHIGVYKAFRDTGTTFDIVGGTSGGAAMAAAFAQDVAPEDIDARVHRMFIDGKAFARYTLPRYSLLDHTHFDAHLIAEYGNTLIEDLWKPYFAVSADLSNGELIVHRSGPVWESIRASAAIPGLLPPFFSSDGRMLVDGSVIANVPIETMHALKRGPNVVVSLNPVEGERFDIDYASLPARRALLRHTLNPFTRGPFTRGALPNAPSAANVLVRSLMANRGRFELHLEPDDWLLTPPAPANMTATDWRQHSGLLAAADTWTRQQILARNPIMRGG
jgi:NTE family protein